MSAAPRRFDAVLFDKDGTLFDFAATWEAWAESLLMRLTEGDRERAGEVGRSIGYEIAARRFHPESVAIAGTPGEVAEALAPQFPGLTAAALIDIINEEAASAPMAEAVPLAVFLDGLRAAGLKLGVATNDALDPALAHLDAAGVRDRFDFIAGFDSGYGFKPEPGQLLAFCEAVGVAPERTVMVGDSTHDLIAGRAAGMATVAVLTGVARSDALSPHADVVFPDIGHLTGWLLPG